MEEQEKQQDQGEDVEAHIRHSGKGLQDEDESSVHFRHGAKRDDDDGDDDVQAHVRDA